MNFSDLILSLMVLTFLPFNEGIIAKSPHWKRLADAIEIGVLKAFTWRANANVTDELMVLERYFKLASIVAGAALAVALLLLKSSALFLWTSLVFFFCFFAWFSFKWTFKHSEALQSFAPMVGYSLIVPWILLALNYLSPKAELMSVFSHMLSFLPLQPSTPFELAATLFLLFVAFFGFYYTFGWLVFSPFAYGILAGLKASRAISSFLVRRFNRNVLNDISVFVQVFGLVYFYWISRKG
ncbi:MAG: hypothetical protein WCT30_05910 [Desulfurivibrionaceae bacterium]|jgi:uncharacterized membrane protein YgdD (TMEM256/DUF423 family)